MARLSIELTQVISLFMSPRTWKVQMNSSSTKFLKFKQIHFVFHNIGTLLIIDWQWRTEKIDKGWA